MREIAIPCGLILNELVTNALKHAFPGGRRGTVSVRAEKLENGRMTLSVADDGVGFSHQLEAKSSTSLGWRLVQALAEQLGAEVKVSNHSGTKISVTFDAAETALARESQS